MFLDEGVLTCISYVIRQINEINKHFLKEESKGQTGDVVSSTHSERITVASARRRLTKTGRLNNTFITCRGPSSCQIHNKQSILGPAHFPTRTSHSAGNLRRGCIDLTGGFLSHKLTNRAAISQAAPQNKPPRPAPSPIKQNNKLTACQNNPSTFVCDCAFVCVQPVLIHCYLLPFTSIDENSLWLCAVRVLGGGKHGRKGL